MIYIILIIIFNVLFTHIIIFSFNKLSINQQSLTAFFSLFVLVLVRTFSFPSLPRAQPLALRQEVRGHPHRHRRHLNVFHRV
jgi:hypothetical protein